MPRTPARFTQADFARAIRAVKQCDVNMRVRALPDGSIVAEPIPAREPTPEVPLDASPLERM
ncbi:MAG: hypothetical protein ABL936_19135 [Aestuariivirga sp.]